MARSWKDVRAAAHLDEGQVALHRNRLDEEARAYRLAEVRRRQELTQDQVASAMGVRRPRASQLDGRLRVVAEFGDEQLVLGS